MATKYVVYAGTGHMRTLAFDTEAEAHDYGRRFDAYCWNHDAPVPHYWVREEEVRDQTSARPNLGNE